MTEYQFDKMEFREYLFLADYLNDKKKEEIKNDMIKASFTAWQIGRFQGLKTSWEQYIRMLGLNDTPEIDEKQARETSAVGLRILKKLGKI